MNIKDDDNEEKEDFSIKPDDNLIVAGHVDQDFSNLEISGEVKVTRPSYFLAVPSYFEALWYPHLYFYRKSNT